jgi:hypothetical protein
LGLNRVARELSDKRILPKSTVGLGFPQGVRHIRFSGGTRDATVSVALAGGSLTTG